MAMRTIRYEPKFKKRFLQLTREHRILVAKAEAIFRQNPTHPSLRLHALKGELKGLWSISAGRHIRIIFQYAPNGEVVFINLGRHDEVYR